MPQLTAHFSREEMSRSRTATRRGIDNTPPDWVWTNLEALCENVLEPARMALGPIRVTSGYRSPDVNYAVGGSPTSQHMTGEAADVEPPTSASYSMGDLLRWIRKNAPFDQLIWEFGEWVHVSHKRTGRNRAQVLLAYKHEGKTVYKPLTEEQVALL